MPSSLQFPSLGYIAKPDTNARSLLCNNIPYLGHVGDPRVMVFPAALLVASNGDVGCGAAHSVSAPRASPLAAMPLLRDPIPRTQTEKRLHGSSSPPSPPHTHQTTERVAACAHDAGGPALPCGGQRAWVSLSPVVSSRQTPCLSASASKTRCSLLGVRGGRRRRGVRGRHVPARPESHYASNMVLYPITQDIRRREQTVRITKTSAKRDIS